jgi:hypothetical protein
MVAGIGAAALFALLLLAVTLLADASRHSGIFPLTTQGKIYRAH